MSESSAVPDEPQSAVPDEPQSAVPDEPQSAESAEPDGSPGEESPEEFTNRAARRAKGKASGRTEVFSKGQRPVGRGSAVQSPRQYGNRRSG